MMKTPIEQILKDNSIANTDSRRKILKLFLDKDGALAHSDIEKKMGDKLDRVTVYRTLQTFMEKGLIHSIPTSDNSIRYALCKNDCSEGHHHDNHVHFKCDKCRNTVCLDKVVTPEIKLPRGFKSEQIEVIVSGICDNCRSAARKKLALKRSKRRASRS